MTVARKHLFPSWLNNKKRYNAKKVLETWLQPATIASNFMTTKQPLIAATVN